MSEARPALSLSRVLAVVLPVALVGGGLYWWSTGLESKAREEMSSNVFARILSSSSHGRRGPWIIPTRTATSWPIRLRTPEKCIAPEVLMFSFVAGEVESVPAEDWQQLLAQLAEKTGREVKYIHYGTTDEQLAALKKGDLHIAGLNTGIVPAAVQRERLRAAVHVRPRDGTYGYTMQLLVPADSPIKKLPALKGHKVTFTRPDSNSGCKVLLALLRDKCSMQPDRDYTWGFSLGHEESIKGVAAKDFEAAPWPAIFWLAWWKRTRSTAGVSLDPRVGTVSAATIGIAYNLTPELRDTITRRCWRSI